MRVHVLPSDWLKPGSEGFKLIAGRGAQLLLLIPCGACSQYQPGTIAHCGECKDSGFPGFHIMRAPLADVLEALEKSKREPGWLEPKTAAQRLLRNALPDAHARLVMHFACPVCTCMLEIESVSVQENETRVCRNKACRAAFEIVADSGGDVVIVPVNPAAAAAETRR